MAMSTEDKTGLMDFVNIRSFENYILAHIALGRLQEEYISCYLQDENTVTVDPLLTFAVGGIKLMVAKPQAQRAADILNSNEGQLPDDSVFPS